MGMFNTIYADSTCVVTGSALLGAEIQIKWQEREYLCLATHKVGDTLEHLEPKFNNTWVKTEFICDACSQHKPGWRGEPYIPTAGQVWHAVYVEVREGRICQILNEKEFAATGVTEFVTYW
jgi:hypothetical protein